MASADSPRRPSASVARRSGRFPFQASVRNTSARSAISASSRARKSVAPQVVHPHRRHSFPGRPSRPGRFVDDRSRRSSQSAPGRGRSFVPFAVMGGLLDGKVGGLDTMPGPPLPSFPPTGGREWRPLRVAGHRAIRNADGTRARCVVGWLSLTACRRWTGRRSNRTTSPLVSRCLTGIYGLPRGCDRSGGHRHRQSRNPRS